MSQVQELLEEITNSFPSAHKVRELLESGGENELEAAELYLRQRHSNYGLSPEDEANLRMLLDTLEDPAPELENIYEEYQKD